MNITGLPEWAEDRTIENYDPTFNGDAELVETLREAAICGKWIGLCSPQTGRGKTHLAIASMRIAAAKGGASFITVLTHRDGERCNGTKQMDGCGVLCMEEHVTREISVCRPNPEAWIFIRGDRLANQLAMAGIGFDARFEYYASHNLLMDELGRNMATKDKQELVQMLIYELYDRGKQLIFTAPYARENLPIDPSILDRMREGMVVNLAAGQSHRKTRKE